MKKFTAPISPERHEAAPRFMWGMVNKNGADAWARVEAGAEGKIKDQA